MQFLSCGLPDHRGGQPVKPEPRRRQRYPLERPHAGAGPDRAPRTAPAQTGSVRTAGQAADLSIADASDTFRPAPRSTAHRLRALLLSEGIPKFIHACGQTEFTCVDAGIRAVHTCESPRRNRVAPLRRDGRVGRRRVARPRSRVRTAASVGEFAARQTALGKAPLARSRKPRCRTQLTRGGAPVDSSRPTATCAADRRGSAPTCSRRRSRRRPSGR